MPTFDTLIADTEANLLAADREEMNLLASDIGAGDTVLTFTNSNDGIQPGSTLSIDLEEMYVWSTNEGANQATVQRAMLGSTAAAHTAGSLVYVNAKFSKYRMAKAVNQEIRDLGAPPNGLFAVKQFTTTTFPVQKTYAIPAPNTDILFPLEVRYQEPGPEFRWIRMDRWEMSMLFEQPTTGTGGFPSGMALRINRPMYPGRTLVVKYAGAFTELVNLTDDFTLTNLPDTAFDIPPLGAAARLMGVREAKRAFVEAEVDTRRASEVPVGSATKAATTLLSLLNQRIRTELSRLLLRWPELM